MDRNRNVRESRSSKTPLNTNTNTNSSTNTNTSTRRLLSKLFLRKQQAAAKTNSDAYSYTTHSTTHSPLKSKATAAAQARLPHVPFGSRSNKNHNNHNNYNNHHHQYDSSNNSKTHSHSNATTLGLSRDATRVLRPSQQKRRQMQMQTHMQTHMQTQTRRQQQSAPDLVGSVLVLPKRIDRDTAAAAPAPTTADIAAADIAAADIAAADIAAANTEERGYQQHGLNHGVSKDETKSTEIPLQSPPSPRRLSRIAATTTTTTPTPTPTTPTPSPTRHRLQFKLSKWQQSFRTGTPLSPSSPSSSVTATIETTENAVEKTTLTRNDDAYQCQSGLVCWMAADDNNLNESKYQTDPPQSPFSPACTRKSIPFDGSVKKTSFSSQQQQQQQEPSVEMACSGDLEDGGEGQGNFGAPVVRFRRLR
jgi:hypothetical protein